MCGMFTAAGWPRADGCASLEIAGVYDQAWGLSVRQERRGDGSGCQVRMLDAEQKVVRLFFVGRILAVCFASMIS